jgi:hypothetical protein
VRGGAYITAPGKCAVADGSIIRRKLRSIAVRAKVNLLEYFKADKSPFSFQLSAIPILKYLAIFKSLMEKSSTTHMRFSDTKSTVYTVPCFEGNIHLPTTITRIFNR